VSDLAGQVALVTGASSGIGRAIVLALSRQGVRIGACSRSETGLRALRDEVETADGRIRTSSVDVRKEEDLSRFAKQILDEWGKIDILVANAGLGIFKRVDEMTLAEFQEQVETNLTGVFLSVKAVLAGMTGRRFGDIVIVSSLAGKNPFATGAAYSASKFGVRGFAHSLMLEVRASNIRVITICPGSVDTPFFDDTPMTPARERILQAGDIADTLVHALLAPRRVMVSEIDIRPSNP
jgi:NADP-dependent 3-hydroxy acid dehydrogenase YdfG